MLSTILRNSWERGRDLSRQNKMTAGSGSGNETSQWPQYRPSGTNITIGALRLGQY